MTQGVVVNLRLSDRRCGTPSERYRLAILEDTIEALFRRRSDMWYDGRDIGEGYCALYCSGDDAGSIVASIRSAIEAFRPATGSYIAFTDGKYLGRNAPYRVELA